MLETKTLLQNRYLVEKQIGSGGMGAVYLAVDQRFGSNVAIKETFYKNDELGEAFEREAHLLNSLHHPALPHVSDFFTENNGHFLVMQFIEGEDLFDTLKREGAFPFQNVLRWTVSLLDALEYLHSQEPPIIHRDIKPQNLKITARGDVILLDFGLAKFNSDDNSGMKSVFGYSRKYSPLEQIQGTGTDARSDLFALAATVYHLLTGIPPIDALTRAGSIVNGEPDPLRPASELNNGIPFDVSNVLTAALALNASKRFVSAEAMRQALSHAVALNASEESKDAAEQAVFIPPIENLIPASSENESFPALESFVAEAVNNSAIPFSNDKSDVNKISSADNGYLSRELQPAVFEVPIRQDVDVLQTDKSFSKVIPDSAAARHVSHNNYSRIGGAVLALLICAGLTTWYFTKAANSQTESNQSPVVQAAPEPISTNQAILTNETVSTESVSPKPEIANSTPAKVKKESENKPVKNETVAEKIEIVEEVPIRVEQTEKPKPIEVKPENKRPAVKKTTAAAASPRESSPPVIEAEVPDIESVFTGRSSQEREKRQQRRQGNRKTREEMTPEELEEFHQIRREERRKRQNRQSFPPL